MPAVDAPDAWTEFAYIGIATKTQAQASEVQFRSVTETIDIDYGEKGGEQIVVLSGGRIWKFNPQEESTITLEAYPVETKSTGQVNSRGFFDYMHTSTASQGQVAVINDRNRQKIRMTVLWTDSATVSNASSAIASQQNAQRMSFAEGYITGIKPAMTDGILKYTITMKIPPFDKGANSTMSFVSETYGDVTGLTVLNTYTGTTYY